VNVRTVDARVFGASLAPDVSPLAAHLHRTGASGPQWCFVADDETGVVARVGFYVDSDPAVVPETRHADAGLLARAWRSTPYTLGVFGLAYRPAGGWQAAELLAEAVGRLAAPAGTVVSAHTNVERHPDPAGRRAVLEAAGFRLFQEKRGYTWRAGVDPDPEPPAGLRLDPISEVGAPRFRAVMAGSSGTGTLDRDDRYHIARCGADGWARTMLEYLKPEAEKTWCLARAATGETVGFFAVSPYDSPLDEPGTATIVHVGVVREHRGRGYGRRLVAAATARARDAGHTSLLSDVDVENRPMAGALLAAGHRDDARLWHIWHHRLTL